MDRGYKVLLSVLLCLMVILVLIEVQKYRDRVMPKTKVSQMLGKGTMIDSIAVTGWYVDDDLGKTSARDICEITDKNKIQAIINEIDKYNLHREDIAKKDIYNDINKKGELKSLYMSLKVSKSNYASMNFIISCNIKEETIGVDVKRRGEYSEAYWGHVQSKELCEYLLTQILGKSAI